MGKELLIKVCGMREDANINEVVNLGIDYIGFIFYPKSPRFINVSPSKELTKKTRRVGVFVNETFDKIQRSVKEYALDAIQLHGSEPVELCSKLKAESLEVLKVFSVSHSDYLVDTSNYIGSVDAFLFDTKTSAYGGSGKQFDWQILKSYQGQTPFFLSGGIQPSSFDEIKNLDHPSLIGIDLNSGFEIRPGVKSIPLLKTFLDELRS
jgi:phosphoribosylanthranilate isomerase